MLLATNRGGYASRDHYNAITNPPEFARALLAQAERSGAWSTGIASDKKQRGSALNTAVYGYDELEQLAVVQVREASFHPRRFTQVRKDYYLIGTTEAGTFFAHPVPSPARSKKALATAESCIQWVLAQIWQCPIDEVPDIERQGDVAFVPVRALPAGAERIEGPVAFRGTHVLTGDIWRHGEDYYTRRGASLRHTKRQHRAIRAGGGYYRVQPGVRSAVWGFTQPVGD